jgi:hypothetical protein
MGGCERALSKRFLNIAARQADMYKPDSSRNNFRLRFAFGLSVPLAM